MLTSDLVRARVQSRNITPRYIDPDDPKLLELAECLIHQFETHRGKKRRELQAFLDDLVGTGTEYLLHRGLAKLLFDRCVFETVSPAEPSVLRRLVFETAAEAYGRSAAKPVDRSTVFDELENRVSLRRDAIEANLYADLKEEQTLTDFDATSSSKLLKRYNVALAQAVVLRADALIVDIAGQSPNRYRELFRSIKFFRLLHTVSGNAADGYRIRLDGPLSLFRSCQRYGVQIATFLPTLLRFDNWKLEAEVLWGKKRARRVFRLGSADGLESDRDLKAQWQPEEIGWLTEQFSRLESDWEVSSDVELIDLRGRGVLVPDQVFVHRPSGNRVYMEIFGFWRRSALASRLALLREHGPENLIVAVSKDLHAGEGALEGLPGEIYVFRNQPIARDVLALLTKFVRDRGTSGKPHA